MQINQRRAGAVLDYTNEAVKILTALTYTPVMLRLLGESEYGLYQLVSSTVAYLSLLSLGFSSAYVRYHSRYYVKEDQAGIARLNGMFMIIFSAMAVLSLVCGSVMTWHANLLFGDGLTAAEQNKAKILMAILVASMTLTFPNTVFSCYVSAYERFVFQKLLNLAQSILNPCIALPLLLLGYDSVAVVAVSAALTAVTFAVNIYYCFKKLDMKFCFRGLQYSLLKEMWGFTLFICIDQIVNRMNGSAGKILLGRIHGTTPVAIYSVGAQIYSIYIQFSTAVVGVFTPIINRIAAKTDNNKDLSAMFIRVGRIQFLLLSLVLTGFFVFGREFIGLWVGEGYSNAYWIALILCLSFTIPLIQTLGTEIQRAKNMHRVSTLVCAGFSVLNVAISAVMIRLWGVVGAALGTAITLLLGHTLFMNWYYHKKIGLDVKAFWKSVTKLLPVAVITCLFGVGYNYFVDITGWTSLALGIGIYVCVYGVLMWFFGMNDYEKKLISDAVCTVTGHRGKKR